jgi:hypothetical protein
MGGGGYIGGLLLGEDSFLKLFEAVGVVGVVDVIAAAVVTFIVIRGRRYLALKIKGKLWLGNDLRVKNVARTLIVLVRRYLPFKVTLDFLIQGAYPA